ncbi:hypothetical protein K2173_009549 [Erythroxylum novogranatense]|uniref:Cytosine-specific methyltransferase n=1 Tax=Erythroxylum novogranatense TaxID=1862640 RepID=A0AAV8U4G6_9ROSI|nr:hypothetical protein K2173_009549 [Erythroxylum novogranatense]
MSSPTIPESLDLILVDNGSSCEPVPLNSYDPKKLRRSSRFTPSPTKTRNVGDRVKKSNKWHIQMRRSPRFCSPISQNVSNGTVEFKSLTRSQRLRSGCAETSVVEFGQKAGGKRKRELKNGEELFEEMYVRRSPRLTTSSCARVRLRKFKMKSPTIKSQRSKCQGLIVKKEKEIEEGKVGSNVDGLNENVLKSPLRQSDFIENDNFVKALPTTCHVSGVCEETQLRSSTECTLETENSPNNQSSKIFVATLSNNKLLQSIQLDAAGENEECADSCGLSDPEREWPLKRIKTHSEDFVVEMLDEKFSKQCTIMVDSGIDSENDKIGHLTAELSISAEERTAKVYSSEKTKPQISGKKCKKFKRCSFIGDPVPKDEAEEKWNWRYEIKSQRFKCEKLPSVDDDNDEDKVVWNVECHYNQAEINGCIFSLGDCAYIKGEGKQKHIGRIVEFFKTTDMEDYFRVQWFYRAEDTVMKDEAAFHDIKRVFFSTIMNDNPLDCIISKITVVQKLPRLGAKSLSVPLFDFYYDMEYCVDYSTFRTLPAGNAINQQESSVLGSVENVCTTTSKLSLEAFHSLESPKAELVLLDVFSGCGGMSTGLCFGAKVSSVDLVTRWALDSDKSACESLKLNHPETYVRNEAAEDFLQLLKEWEKLCKRYVISDSGKSRTLRSGNKNRKSLNGTGDPDELEVARLVDICYGDPDKTGKHGLKFKVQWKGFDASEDTWEPIEGLRNCVKSLRNFVRTGYKSKILPLPGDVDVICGGPPCQGISGYNRFRNVDSPLKDERNQQIIVFMDIVQFLKPKFVLMENVCDILKFDKGSLGRYALSRLVHMRYQARLGIIAAGCYGLPQFRLRVFLWGAHPSEKLPKFPLPSHDVIVRYWPPPEFERNTVAYDEGQPRELEKAIVLQDAISDLPAVTSNETREKMQYAISPETDFQRYIRSTRNEMLGSALNSGAKTDILYDHRPYSLTEDDYARVCQIPKRKGSNFRDLPGIVVGGDNVVRLDPTQEKIMLPSGKPLVPDFALRFEQGKSKRPYARLWWDETVSTIVTYPDLHSQAVIHPEQDRVLTMRECARLQGFPDYYRFSGTVKERYRQIGNAVAVPVGRALGYCLGMAFRKIGGDEPLMKLAPKFSLSTYLDLANPLVVEDCDS